MPPLSTPGAIVSERTWEDYPIGRAGTQQHLEGLDTVYRGVIEDHRAAVAETDKLDLVTQDLLIGQTEKLELFHWFVRAHLEDKNGRLSTDEG